MPRSAPGNGFPDPTGTASSRAGSQTHRVPAFRDLVQAFLAFKAGQGRSERTLTDYRKHLGRLVRMLPDNRTDLRGAVLGYFETLASMSPSYG
jgi:hypothetical protein